MLVDGRTCEVDRLWTMQRVDPWWITDAHILWNHRIHVRFISCFLQLKFIVVVCCRLGATLRTDECICWSTILGIDLSWFSSLSPECLCIFDLHGAMNIVNFLWHLFLYLLVSWAWWDWPLTWLTVHCPSVLWHCWLGLTTCKIVSEMTYNVWVGRWTLLYYIGQ